MPSDPLRPALTGPLPEPLGIRGVLRSQLVGMGILTSPFRRGAIDGYNATWGYSGALRMTGISPLRHGIAWIAAGLFALATLVLAPIGIEADSQLAKEDDPIALAQRGLAKTFDATLATREIAAALKADDAELAKSFVELAQERGVALDPALVAKVEAANATSAQATRAATTFAQGFITGEPDDLVGFAGTALGDLFVYGDIRDVVREGSRLVSGEQADELILGLACVGLAVTAGTYATLGAVAPARVGLSVVKAARRTGRLSARMSEWMSRSVREVVDWSAMKRAFAGASLAEPALVVRAAREAVKVDKADNLVRLVGDVGRVQSKAGTRAALDGLKIAEGPRDMSKLAKLADAKGGKTRAILKTLGRGAIALTLASFNLAMWMFWALFALFGFVSSLKTAVERFTQRRIDRRKEARILQRERYEAMMAPRV